MSKGWDPGFADAGCIDKSSHSATSDPYDQPPVGQPHAAYRVPSSACEQGWILGMVAAVEGSMMHLRLAADGPAPAAVPALAYNTFL